MLRFKDFISTNPSRLIFFISKLTYLVSCGMEPEEANSQLDFKVESKDLTLPSGYRGQAIVTAEPWVNIRKGPRTDEDVVGKAEFATVHDVKFVSQGFAQVEKGWITVDYLQLMKSVEDGYKGKAIVSLKSGADVYQSASDQSIKETLKFGTIVEVKTTKHGFAQVAKGWIKNSDLSQGSVAPGSKHPGALGSDIELCGQGRPKVFPAVAALNMSAAARALISTIAYAEGTGPCYNQMYSHKPFHSFVRHPNTTICGGKHCSTAAGRMQWLFETWNERAKVLGVSDFSPKSQDRVTLTFFRNKGVDPNKVHQTQTSLAAAVAKLNGTWASLPGSPYGQPVKSMSTLWNKHQEYTKSL